MSLVPRTRRGAGWRFFAASVLIIALSAATTAVAGLLKIHSFVVDLSQHASIFGLTGEVQLPPPGAAETILVVGSDHRAGTPYNSANTDTMMLVRLDPASQTINVISVPRDLAVTLPGAGQDRLNAAYSIGGMKLLVHTLRTQVFPRLVVNHVVDVNFAAFEKLVDAIGCVYAQVDHRYYNNTVYTGYSSIDIQPGYQRLCDARALAFVRFRHTDSDITRNARQQDFIRWAKDNYTTGQLLANSDRLLRIFGANAQVDHGLQTTDGLIGLFDLVVNLQGHTIKTIPFPYTAGPCTAGGQTPCYLFSTPPQEQIAFRRFMAATVAPVSSPSVATSSARHRGHPNYNAGLSPDPADGRSQAGALGRIALPVYYPKLIQAGSYYCFAATEDCPTQGFVSEFTHSYPRAYAIRAPDGRHYPAYYMTLAINPSFGWYYGVQGTTWQNPPILSTAHTTRVVNGRTLEVFSNGGQVSLVAWRTPQGVYWISNTLDDHIPNGQMIGMAASLTRY